MTSCMLDVRHFQSCWYEDGGMIERGVDQRLVRENGRKDIHIRC